MPIDARRMVLFQMRCPFQSHAVDCNLLTLSPMPLSYTSIVSRLMSGLMSLLFGAMYTCWKKAGGILDRYPAGRPMGDRRSSEWEDGGWAVNRVSFHLLNDEFKPVKISPLIYWWLNGILSLLVG